MIRKCFINGILFLFLANEHICDFANLVHISMRQAIDTIIFHKLVTINFIFYWYFRFNFRIKEDRRNFWFSINWIYLWEYNFSIIYQRLIHTIILTGRFKNWRVRQNQTVDNVSKQFRNNQFDLLCLFTCKIQRRFRNNGLEGKY